MFLLLGLLLAGTEPVDTTIAALRADPRAWSGKTVRLSGQIDQCSGFSCNLCPAEMTGTTADAKRCLALSLEDGAIPARIAENGVRFSQVTLTARFDPACMLKDRIRCLDRASVLLDARVEKVAKRYRSSEGLWNDRPHSMLKPLPEAESAKVLADAAHFRPQSPGTATRIFRADNDADRAILCTVPQYAANKPEVWPNSWEGAILTRSAIDIYDCVLLRRFDQGWYLAAN